MHIMYSAALENLLKDTQKLRIIEPTAAPVAAAPVAAAPVAAVAAVAAVPVPVAAVAATQVAALPIVPVGGKVTYFSSTVPKKSVPKRKILMVSTHSQQLIGQSKVAWNLLKILAANPEFEVYQYGGQKDVAEFRPTPANVRVRITESENGFDFSGLKSYVEEVTPSVVVIYNDAFISCKYIEAIKECTKNFKTVVYLDQTYYSLRSDCVQVLNTGCDELFVATNSWKSVLAQNGIKIPMYVLNHGFDSNMHPTIDKLTARKNLGIPVEGFYIVSANRNTVTKRYDTIVAGFAELVCKHPKAELRLLCACDAGKNGGYLINEIYIHTIRKFRGDYKEHKDKLILAYRDKPYTDNEINMMYNAADIGISCAGAEGFGLCAFEMMGLGKPQVVSEQLGHLEYCTFTNSIVVPTVYTYYTPTMSSAVSGEAHGVDSSDVCTALERYFLDAELVKTHGSSASATVAPYTWNTVCAEFIGRLRA
jgi:glycosyltransferase involved in cell wall biosynthesis